MLLLRIAVLLRPFVLLGILLAALLDIAVLLAAILLILLAVTLLLLTGLLTGPLLAGTLLTLLILLSVVCHDLNLRVQSGSDRMKKPVTGYAPLFVPARMRRSGLIAAAVPRRFARGSCRFHAAAMLARSDKQDGSAMSVRIVRLGSSRATGEGTRIGTVRRPPRGVRREDFAKQDWYDVWFPTLAPSLDTMKLGQVASTPAQWAAFIRKYRMEMAAPDAARALDLLAVLSQRIDFSVGCYCENESHCHRSVLRALLTERGARLV